jgi:hypothetical protein
MTSRRDIRIDAIRGVAVVLMVLDHALAFAEVRGWSSDWLALRWTVTRFSLPLFMISSGWLWSCRGSSGLQGLRVMVAAVVASVFCVMIGLNPIHILWSFLAARVFAYFIINYPVASLLVGFLQAWNVQHPGFDYQIGYVIGWLAVGVLVEGRSSLVASGDVLSSLKIPAAIGRFPLSVFVGHLAILAYVAVLVASNGGASGEAAAAVATPD